MTARAATLPSSPLEGAMDDRTWPQLVDDHHDLDESATAELRRRLGVAVDAAKLDSVGRWRCKRLVDVALDALHVEDDPLLDRRGEPRRILDWALLRQPRPHLETQVGWLRGRAKEDDEAGRKEVLAAGHDDAGADPLARAPAPERPAVRWVAGFPPLLVGVLAGWNTPEQRVDRNASREPVREAALELAPAQSDEELAGALARLRACLAERVGEREQVALHRAFEALLTLADGEPHLERWPRPFSGTVHTFVAVWMVQHALRLRHDPRTGKRVYVDADVYRARGLARDTGRLFERWGLATSWRQIVDDRQQPEWDRLNAAVRALFNALDTLEET